MTLLLFQDFINYLKNEAIVKFISFLYFSTTFYSQIDSVSYLAGVCVSQSRNCGIFNGRNLAPDLTIFQCSKIGDIICHQFQIKDYSPTNIMTCGIIDKELDFNFNSQFQKRYLEPMTYSPVINRKRTNKLKRYDLSFLSNFFKIFFEISFLISNKQIEQCLNIFVPKNQNIQTLKNEL